MFKSLYKSLCAILLFFAFFCFCNADSYTHAAQNLVKKTDNAVKNAANVQKNNDCAPTESVNYVFAKPLQIVQYPDKFLGKDIKMNATFDKFSTLGLDYNRALRPSSDYIGFLIRRDDVVDHNIPLSEMKLFLKREYAEKFIDLDTGDRIEISGNVFSNALGDAWIDVKQITVLNKVKADKAQENKKSDNKDKK